MNPAQLADQHVEAYNDRDPEAMAYVDDVVMLLHEPDGARYDNVHEVRQHWMREWTSYPDAWMEVVRVVAEADAFVAQLLWRGTNTGPRLLPDGSALAPTYRPCAQRRVSICEVADDRITRVDQYVDVPDVLNSEVTQ